MWIYLVNKLVYSQMFLVILDEAVLGMYRDITHYKSYNVRCVYNTKTANSSGNLNDHKMHPINR